MCAINGFTYKDEALARRMNACLSHRGPDGNGIYADEEVTLGHNRLSILDLSEAAAQPMQSPDRRYVIVLNGEIYNFRELREQLSSTVDFKSSSDTEVLLAAYARWGAECVKKLNGIFAFVIWDREQKELFLARDHNGIKPLYYTVRGSRLWFSSGINALLEAGTPRTLNYFGFNAYLRVQYVPEPHTAFTEIKKLPAAHYGIFKGGTLHLTRYWRVGYSPEARRRGAWTQVVEEAVDAAVKRQLVSDRPLGVYLSGGIDSSIVLDAITRTRGQADAFSVGFQLAGGAQLEEKFNADLRLAERTADFYGARHHILVIGAKEAASAFEEVTKRNDDLISNPTAVSMVALSRFAKSKVDVVMGGDGGDELFGGYPRYRWSLLASYWQRLPPFFRHAAVRFSPQLGKLEVPAGVERWAQFHFLKDKEITPLLADGLASQDPLAFFGKAFFSEPFAVSFEERLLETDRASWLTDYSLALSDKMSMAHAVEARVPLLDRELIELAVRIPIARKVGMLKTKKILKQAFRKRLPSYLLHQPKRGWISPAAKWLREPPVRELARELLNPGYYAPTASLFAWPEITRRLEAHLERREYHLTALWALMTFQAWARQFGVSP